MGIHIKFEDGDELIWNASTEEAENNQVIYKERTGANTATVQRGDYEFEVFLDELEIPEEF
tara:strand:- start:104 stop:286 length:183 start_codon:yes stop_codon:yes gene_type:complete